MKKIIIECLEDALNKINVKTKVELTTSKGFADFSTNIAMKLANELKDTPINIAKKIIKVINLKKYNIKKIEVAAPGFINIFMEQKLLSEIVKNIIKKKGNYGKGSDYEKNKSGNYINVEYVSANPTGYLHVGHARGAVIGSTLVNILKFAGNKVDTDYYVNDAGKQIDILGESVFVRYLQAHNQKIEMPKVTYKGKDIIWVAETLKNKFGNKYINSKYQEVSEVFKNESKSLLLKEIKKDLKLLGVELDVYFLETKLYKEKLIQRALTKLKDTYQKDGAMWLKTTKYGDDKDRVLIKSDKSYTYLTPDIAYHNVKLERGYDYLINIWGADHIGYIKRMEVALQQLGHSNTLKNTLIIQWVKLIQNGKELKMSKRLGTSVTLRELVDLVGKDAARFFLINRTYDSKIEFDINLAKEKSSKNPVFYIQYAYARANQLLNKSKVICEKENINIEKAEKLINLLAKFPELIKTISENQKIYLLSKYMIEVAREFHSYYNSNKIIGSENEKSKIAIVKAVKQVIENGLKLLNINILERM